MMANPLFNELNQSNNTNIFQQLDQFRRNLTEDPQKKVMELMRSGKLTQEKLNQIQNSPIAKMLYGFLTK